MAPLAPSPSHIIRAHGSQISTVSFSKDNERIYSGDVSGTVVVTSTRTLRSIAAWKPHSDGILGVEEWLPCVITHGRDNKLHVWSAVLEQEFISETATRDNSILTPELLYSLDVNALNFCRFSLCPDIPQPGEDMEICAASSSSSSNSNQTALLAVPNLVESSLADIWELPSKHRLHAAIGKNSVDFPGGLGDGRESKTGIIMAMELFFREENSSDSTTSRLHLLAAYESGEVALYRCTTSSYQERSIEGRGWACIWKTRQHAETVMAMAISPDKSFALTVSADHLVVRYNLWEPEDDDTKPRFVKHRIRQIGNGAIDIRDDGRVCAIGGWDGKIRLFSTKSMKPLGTLAYHSKSCKGIAFAHKISDLEEDSEDADGMTKEEKESRALWLVGGSEDNRLSLWQLMSFKKDS